MSKNKYAFLNAFNVQSTFFIPLWRRVFVVALSALWAILEFANGNPYWALLFGAVAAYCAHQFFIVFNPEEKDE